MNPQRLRFPLLAATLLAAFSPASLSAATVTWTGNGDSNNSGDWVNAANWTALPSIGTLDVATLPNVSTGTRTITINSGETGTARTLAFTQTTAGASNILTVASGGTLTLGSAQTWGAVSSVGTMTVNVGGTVDFTTMTSGAITLYTGLNLTGSGAVGGVFRSSSNANGVFDFYGPVNVTAGAATAQIATTNTGRTLTSTFKNTSSLAITSGVLEFTATKIAGSVGVPTVNTVLQGTTTISSGAAMRLAITGSGSGSSGVALTNSGTMTQGGTVTLNGRGTGAAGANSITNSGTWIVSGTSAFIEKGTNVVTSLDPTFANSSTGVFTGATSADQLDYNHLLTAGTDLAFTNSGVIAAGNGSNGLVGLASVGTLTLVDFAVTNASGSSLVFDIGGTSAGQFDVLAFQSGSLVLTNATLAINLVNGFTPGSSFSVDILTSDVPASITGSFVGLTVNGSANADYSFAYNSTTGIGTLTFTSSIPEPSSYALAAGLAMLGLAVLRRRAGNVSA